MTTNTATVVASPRKLSADRAVWGTGGWLEPEDREALDWLTLCRLLGWEVSVTDPSRVGSGARWLIAACELGPDATAAIEGAAAEHPTLAVLRAEEGEVVRGRVLRWIAPGPAREWACGEPLEARELDGTPWVTLDGRSVVTARSVNRGVVATLGFHPSRLRDADGCATALLIHLLTCGVPGPVAWLDLTGTVVLRMDDPGGSQNVHAAGWSYPKLGTRGWNAIRAELRRRDARMSIGYVAGWVDDGDETRGELVVGGGRVERVAGRVHPSPAVQYRDGAGTVHDYAAEARAIQTLRASGLGDVELHGYTHLHPERERWASAPDRYDALSWYRELGTPAATALATLSAEEHPLGVGAAALGRLFGVRPTTLIPPGDEWTDHVLERALALELSFVASYYLALRDGDRFCWSTHVCAPYLDEADPSWFASGLPVVGYFHDYEPAVHGLGWLERRLDEWRSAGARRLVDFRELAGAIGRRIAMDGMRLRVERDGAPDLVRQVPVFVRVSPLPASLPASIDGHDHELAVEPLDVGLGRVLLPV